MLKMFDFTCRNKACDMHEVTQERFIHEDDRDDQRCIICGKPLDFILSAVAGWVPGSHTPTRF